MKLRALVFLATLVMPIAVSGCGEGDVDAEDSDIRAAAIKVLGGFNGSGPYSLPVSYTSTPLYRAYGFTANKGDIIHFRVKQADGGDAYAYLLSASFGVLAKNDDENASTKDSYLRTTIDAPGKYYVAFRDKAYRAGNFTINFFKDEPIPTCEGTPKFPTTGVKSTGISATQYNYERDCSARQSPGEACPWKLFQRVNATAFSIAGVASVSSTRDVRFDFGLKRYEMFDASSRYNCAITDAGSVKLDANGQGTTKSTYADACIGGPSNEKTRSVRVSLGSTCLAVTDADGLEDGRMQVYIAQLKP